MGIRDIFTKINAGFLSTYLGFIVVCYLMIIFNTGEIYNKVNYFINQNEFTNVIFVDVNYIESPEDPSFWRGNINGKWVKIEYPEGLNKRQNKFRLWYSKRDRIAFYNNAKKNFPASRLLSDGINKIGQLLLCILLGYYGLYLRKKQYNSLFNGYFAMTKTMAYFLGIFLSIGVVILWKIDFPFHFLISAFALFYVCIGYIVYIGTRPD